MLLSLSGDDLLGLTYRLAESAKHVDPALELIVAFLALARVSGAKRIHPFAVPLRRHAHPLAGLNLSGLDIELVMGVTPCAAAIAAILLEILCLLDLYALLGVPLYVTLATFLGGERAPDADPDRRVEGGRWGNGFTPDVQAAWAAEAAAVGLVQTLQAGNSSGRTSATPNRINSPLRPSPDRRDNLKPALQKIRELCEPHLK